MSMLFTILAQYGYDNAFYGSGYGYTGGGDYTAFGLLLVGACFLIGMLVHSHLESAMKEYAATPAPMTGADAAQLMLSQNGLSDVRITCVPGKLTDHYNPLDKTVNLSEAVYHNATVASVAVAAHECGHAIQHAQAYPWLSLRSSLVPVVNIGSRLGQIVLMLGLVLLGTGGGSDIAWVGLALYGLTTVFALVTLPVEFDASHRALSWLHLSGLADRTMHGQASSALRAAAMTYVAAALSSIAMLAYYALIILARSNNRRN